MRLLTGYKSRKKNTDATLKYLFLTLSLQASRNYTNQKRRKKKITPTIKSFILYEQGPFQVLSH